MLSRHAISSSGTHYLFRTFRSDIFGCVALQRSAEDGRNRRGGGADNAEVNVRVCWVEKRPGAIYTVGYGPTAATKGVEMMARVGGCRLQRSKESKVEVELLEASVGLVCGVLRQCPQTYTRLYRLRTPAFVDAD